MRYKYENRYGVLEVEPIEEHHKVSEILGKNIEERFFFDLETSEKIALITDNKDIQLGFLSSPPYDKVYLVHHLTGSLGAVCRITKLLESNILLMRGELLWKREGNIP